MDTGISCSLPEELAIRLHQYTEAEGITAEDFVRRLLDQSLPPLDPEKEKRRREEVLAWLQSRIDAAQLQEREEDDEYDLYAELDKHRPEGQKLFPPELKGISW